MHIAINNWQLFQVPIYNSTTYFCVPIFLKCDKSTKMSGKYLVDNELYRLYLIFSNFL